MPTKDIDVEEEQVEITKTPAKRRKQVFQRAVKRNYQRHDVGQKTR